MSPNEVEINGQGGTIKIRGSSVVNNNATHGGGLWLDNLPDEATNVVNSTVSGNAATGSGGCSASFTSSLRRKK